MVAQRQPMESGHALTAGTDIALVSQPIDSVLPPVMNSLGINTHELAVRLATRHRVRVFAARSAPGHRGLDAELRQGGVEHYLLASDDTTLHRLWPVVAATSELLRGGLRPPMSASRLFGFRYIRGVARVLAADPPDVIHVRSAAQLLPPLRAACPNAALVLSVHAAWHPHFPIAALTRQLAAADLIEASSQYIADSLVALVPSAAARLQVVPNGIDNSAVQRRREVAGRRTPGRLILYVGGLSAHKGVHDLIAAFIPLARTTPDLRLRLVGAVGNYPAEEVWDLTNDANRRFARRLHRGDYGHYLHSLIPDDLIDRIEFTGPVHGDDLLDLFLDADIFVSPTASHEGFGRPVIEAMAAGLPVVTTRSGGTVETVEDGHTGLHVDRMAPDQLQHALSRLLNDAALRTRMGGAAENVARERYDWHRITMQTEAAYRTALEIRRCGTAGRAR